LVANGKSFDFEWEKGGNMKKIILMCVFGLVVFGMAYGQGFVITSPNGGEDWKFGTTHAITWGSSSMSGNVKIGLFKGGTHLGNIVEHQFYQTGVNWHVGDPLLNGAAYGAGSDYKIQVQSEVDWHWKDQSDNDFTLSTLKFRPERYREYEIWRDPGCPMCGIFNIRELLEKLGNPPDFWGELVILRNGKPVADLGKLGRDGKLLGEKVKVKLAAGDFAALGQGAQGFELAVLGPTGIVLNSQVVKLRLK
jgi:hypothetical protein